MNKPGDLCNVWKAMNNMITLQHIEIKASFETSTHVVGHLPYTKKLLGMVSRYALNQIVAKYERVSYANIDSSRCGCVMRTTHDLPCGYELARYVVSSISLGVIHMFWWRLSFSDQGLSEPEVSISEEMETISWQFQELDVCGKKRSTPKRDSSYWEYVDALDSVRTMPVLNQFHLCIHDFIENIVDVKADSNCGYRLIAVLLELAKWSDEYINLLGGIDRFEELKQSLLFDGLSMVTMNKWMNITDIEYFIVSRYNVILVSLSLQKKVNHQQIVLCITQYVSIMCMIIILFRERYPLPPLALLWSRHCHPLAKQWLTLYISRMQQYKNLLMLKIYYVDLSEE
ncbi:hypothetical protein HKD37_13G036817 [Glycine soja]